MPDQPTTLPELIAALAYLEQLRGVERTALARRLATVAPSILRAAGDQGVYEATRRVGPDSEQPWGGRRQHEVAAELGVHESQVERAVTMHRRRLRDARSVDPTAG